VARFRINGLIVAAHLPHRAFHLFDCTIEPTATPQSSPDARRLPLGFIPAAGIQFASVEALPPQIKVEARHSITTELDAESWDDARSISNERFGRCLSAIAFASDPLHHGMAVITGWQELAVDGSVLHPHPLRRDDLSRRIDKIAQRLPPDGGVRIEHPVKHGHGS
jgi:hypothetical protein